MFYNEHAGVLVFTSTLKSNGDQAISIDNLTLALQSLDSNTCIQSCLAKVINSAHPGNEQIKPQMISTLPHLVKFPPLNGPYEPRKFNLFQKYFISGA
jgi:hypothetical protein